jgi:hypothetical protein
LSRITHRRLTLLAISLLAFVAWLGKRDVATSHEARVGQTARLMAASGWPWNAQPAEAAAMGVRPDAKGTYAVPRFDIAPLHVNPWLVPVLNGQIRLQKPPLPNWCAATLYRLTGRESEFATRFVPALMGALVTFLVADLAALILGRAAALVAGLAWAGTLTVVLQFREATADPYLAFFTALAVWAWVRASSRVAGNRFRAHRVVLTRASASACYRRGRSSSCTSALRSSLTRDDPSAAAGGLVAHLAGLALMLAIALPWPAYVLTHVENVIALWKMETTRGEGERGVGYILSHLWEFPARSFELALAVDPVLAHRARGGGVSATRRAAFQPRATIRVSAGLVPGDVRGLLVFAGEEGRTMCCP